MKISKLFHLLYFAVLCLPILAIPIFGIYAHRHTIDTYAVEQEEIKVVDFNQQFNNNEQPFVYEGVANNERLVFNLNTTSLNLVDNHIYYSRATLLSVDFSFEQYFELHFVGWSNFDLAINFYSNTSVGFLGALGAVDNSNDSYIVLDSLTAVSGNYSLSFYYCLFDLTQMFGSGNEPTVVQFNNLYPNDYYSYTTGRKESILTGNTITYDDTDIGSQLIYTSYNTVNNYFNYDKVFNFGALYDWLQVNFFVGNAPLGFFIFWHLLIYWLLTSLLWLLFDVLIYVPMVIHKWLDKASM